MFAHQRWWSSYSDYSVHVCVSVQCEHDNSKIAILQFFSLQFFSQVSSNWHGPLTVGVSRRYWQFDHESKVIAEVLDEIFSVDRRVILGINPDHNPVHRYADIVCARRLKLFGHVARADKSQDHSRVLRACIWHTPKNWKRRLGRPRHTWLRTVEADLRPFNLSLASGIKKAQDRTTWRTLTGTATSSTSPEWWWWWWW